MSALLALASAITFGAADFTGGVAARRAPVLTVTTLAQAAGLVVLGPALLLLGGTLSAAAMATGAVAGVAGAVGLLVYLRALAIGPMGVASPVAGVVGAVLPVTVGFAAGERPTTIAMSGVALGLLAIVLASWSDSRSGSSSGLRAPLLALLGGLGFGWFFVALDASPPDSGLWPLLATRLSSLVLLAALLLARRRAFGARGTIGLAAATGLLDMAANVLFLAATRTGLLSLAALIVSLYPVVVAVLAHQFLGERLHPRQRLGIVACVIAVGLIAVG